MHYFNAIISSGTAAIEAQIVQLEAEQTLENLFEALYRFDSILRYRSSLVVVRTPVATPIPKAIFSGDETSSQDVPSFLKQVRADPKQVFGRVNDKPVLILASDNFAPYLTSDVNPITGRST